MDTKTNEIDLTWCYWCDRPRVDCACHLDPNGIPPGHWSMDVEQEQEEQDYECPNCGDTGGSPVFITSREFQGCAEHGGMVETEEEFCTLCASGRGFCDGDNGKDCGD